jgi:hypothetical protein
MPSSARLDVPHRLVGARPLRRPRPSAAVRSPKRVDQRLAGDSGHVLCEGADQERVPVAKEPHPSSASRPVADGVTGHKPQWPRSLRTQPQLRGRDRTEVPEFGINACGSPCETDTRRPLNSRPVWRPKLGLLADGGTPEMSYLYVFFTIGTHPFIDCRWPFGTVQPRLRGCTRRVR